MRLKTTYRMAPGYTLFELVVYLAILSTVLVIILLIANSMFVQYAKVRGSYAVWDNLSYAKQRIAYALQNADAIDVPINGSGNVLSLGMSSGDSSDTVSFTLDDGMITMSVRGESPVGITTPEVVVTALSFERVQSTVPMVRYTLEARLNSADPAFQKTVQVTGMSALNR